MQTNGGHTINILSEYHSDLYGILLKNRNIKEEDREGFFHPQISDLHDPYLMPDMEKAVNRILVAREKKERIVIFGDYDVDGVSSTAILVKFLTEIGCLVSYRLPHRVHDGYGLKSYFFDELGEKWVTLVITVDCGTRDIWPIKHAKTIGIDVIVTDHHAVPDIIPEEVIAIVNPKRKDSLYPFHGLAGAWVAFKLLHGILITLEKEKQWNLDVGLPLDKGGRGDFIRWHLPYNPDNREKARILRNNMPEAEKKLWLFLRWTDITWLRQKPIDNYIVDFYCSKYQLVIEIDGATHGTIEEKKYDAERTKILESYWFQVIRFMNIEVYESYDWVCESIMSILKEQSKIPLAPFIKGEWAKERVINETLTRYIDFASLGTVADCMPITGENRVITTLGLRQMQQSESVGLRNFLEWREQIEWNADIIGFHIGPRINAAGRMDTPLTALRWLLAGEGRTDEFFGELEHLNEIRKWTTETHFQKALENIDTSKPVLFYDAPDLEHGIIGLVAGRLTEIYNKPTIVIKNGHNHPLTSRKWDTVSVLNPLDSDIGLPLDKGGRGDFWWKDLSIGSCRSPEWCNLIELLDHCKELFVRYGGHRQAAGFTIETDKIEEFKRAMWKQIACVHDIHNLPTKILNIECPLPATNITIKTLEDIDHFRPFGIGNPKPLFILENITIATTKPLGQEEKHLSITIVENPSLKFLLWNASDKKAHLIPGNILSLIIEIDRNEWKWKVSVQIIVRDIIV